MLNLCWKNETTRNFTNNIGSVGQGAASENIKENYCFSLGPLECVDLIPLACQDKNFLYHSSRAWYSLALGVRVTEFPSLLLGNGFPTWNITWSKHRPRSLRSAFLGITRGTETPWVNCRSFHPGLLSLICVGCLHHWDRGVCVCVCMLGGTPLLIHRNSTTVSVCLGCDNKSTINWLGWKQQKVLLTAAEAGSPRSKWFGVFRVPPYAGCVLLWWRGKSPTLMTQSCPRDHTS